MDTEAVEAAPSVQNTSGAQARTDEDKLRLAELIVQRLRGAGIQCELGGWLDLPSECR
jgi:hypothetical protein